MGLASQKHGSSTCCGWRISIIRLCYAGGKITSLGQFCLVVFVYVGGCLHGGELHLGNTLRDHTTGLV